MLTFSSHKRQTSTEHKYFMKKIIVCYVWRVLFLQNWHPGAQKTAQHWAEQCELLTHDNATDRWMPLYGHCGQNIFVSTRKVPW